LILIISFLFDLDDDCDDVVYTYPPPPEFIVTHVLERLPEFVEGLETDQKEDWEWELKVMIRKKIL
jgi:hypothetical protein